MCPGLRKLAVLLGIAEQCDARAFNQLGSERAGSSIVGQRDSEATFADGHPHA
jgi:hypothetical protein